ncbi:MAG: LamG-like jellyroll fold domain-containing protein [Phycisphaerales bacterium]
MSMSSTGFVWHHSARAVLAVLIMSMAAQAGTFTIVDLPATGTDAAIGIDSTKEYTHTFDFGSGTVATVNGVAFEQGLSGTISAAYAGTSQQGYGWTITDTRASVSIAIHAGSDPSAQCDGDSVQLLYDMIYHSASTTIGAGVVLTLSDLTPGVTYSTRYYYRSWGTGETARTITIQGDGGHNGDLSDTIDIEIDGGGAHYLDYTFVADDTDVTFHYLTNDNNNGIHVYALSNEVASAAGSAVLPSPGNGATDVLRDVVLSWQADEAAETHNVYFGASREAVVAATTADPELVSEGQDETTFDAGRLEFGQTYYWRVDEVGASVVAGTVWSFTVEPRSYALAGAKITATASSVAGATMGPENTINGSGLNASDQHSSTSTHMWLSAMGETAPWIQYEFDQAYRLDKMLVWNSNQAVETALGWGAKAVTIEVSLDGETWTAVGDFEFAQAPGLDTYTTNTTVDFAGAGAKYVKLAINSNWGGTIKQYGLSEVRFFQVPTYAADPVPTSGKTSLAPAVTLSWRPGREAASHQVFVGTDVNDLSLVDAVDEAACEVDLTLDQTYYWKVVEVNDAETPSTWESPVWSFSTNDSLIVDDFESYDDVQETGTTIFQTWIDGWGIDENGSLVGHNAPPFAEQTILVAGKQSMPFSYDNTSAAYSEAERVFEEAQNWTEYDVRTLSLYFFGDADNAGAGQLYVKINGTKILYGGAAADLQLGSWMPWTIDLASTGVNLKKVTKLAIGVEGSGATGNLFIDDIRLYPVAGATATPVDPGTTGLVAYYKFDGDAKDSAGSHHGTATGSPGFVTGKTGQALNMTADGQYVAVAYAPDLAMSTFTIGAWINAADFSALRAILGTRIGGDYTFDVKAEATRIHGDIGNGTAWLNTSLDISTARGGVIDTGEWHHVAYVIDNATQAAYMYLDGALGATATFSGTPMFMTSAETLGIGYCSSGEYMHGQIDEVRIYNRALSEAEVADLVGRTGPIYIAP